MTARARLERGLDGAAPWVVALAVLAAAAGYSSQYQILQVGHVGRWALLGGLFVLAAAQAGLHGREWRFPGRTAYVIAAFCGLSLVSVAWSVNDRGTLERALAQIVVVAALAVFAGRAVLRPELGARLLDGVLAAAAAIALAGFVYWLVDPSRAANPATVEYPTRYHGIVQSPNTAPLLLAIAMPIALWRGLTTRGRLGRSLLALVLVGFAASISASGSRGGLAAGFFALLVVAVLSPLPTRRRTALAALVVAGLVVSAWATTIPKALPAQGAATAPAPRPTRNAEQVLPLEQEIGNPWWTHRSGLVRRSLFDTSVRLRALEGTLGRAMQRPLLGYGFGAEQWAFVDRYYAYSSENPENGYVGILLQLGIVGLVAWVVALAACALPAVRVCVRGASRHPFALGAVGAAAGALGMGVSQSYFHGPGGIGYVALWTSLLLAAVAAQQRVPDRR